MAANALSRCWPPRLPMSIPPTPVKNFEYRIELAFFYLITVAFITRFNQVFDNTKALADDTFLF